MHIQYFLSHFRILDNTRNQLIHFDCTNSFRWILYAVYRNSFLSDVSGLFVIHMHVNKPLFISCANEYLLSVTKFDLMVKIHCIRFENEFYRS